MSTRRDSLLAIVESSFSCSVARIGPLAIRRGAIRDLDSGRTDDSGRAERSASLFVLASPGRIDAALPDAAVRAGGRRAGGQAALGATPDVAGADREPARSRPAGGQRRVA